MKFSIITVCRNSEKTIAQALDSVARQDYPEIEHILVDGGSSDSTIEIIRSNESPALRWISERDRGIYQAMNKGLALARGEVVAMLNSDDVYADQEVLRQVARVFEQDQPDAVYGDLVYVDPSDPERIRRYWKTGRWRPGAFQKGWVIPHPAFFCRKEIYDKLGGFREEFKVAGDFELLLRFVEKHRIRCSYLPRVLVKMRRGGKANRLGGILQGNREILRSFGLNSLRPHPLFFFHKLLLKLRQYLEKPVPGETEVR